MKNMKKLLKFKNKLTVEMKYKDFDRDKASERDNWIIKRYTDEWSWFMQGWMECVNSQP